jgi:hypothetical protein
MASYLEPRQGLLGVGPEADLIDKHLFDAEGKLREYGELSEELGDMQAFLGLLELELRKRIRAPHARGYPPRIFISYRRESPEDIAWCGQLAAELEGLDYDVLLDELALGPYSGDFPALAKFMGQMADADLAVLVVTDGFLFHEGRQNSMRNWIFEEWTRIASLVDWGLLETVVVHRDGNIEDSFLGDVGARSAYIDLREDASSPRPVAEFFGRWDGKRLGPADRLRLGAGAAEAVRLSLGQEPDPAGALAAFTTIEEFAGTEEHAVAEAHVRAANGDLDGAFRIAAGALKRNPSLPGCFLLGRLLWLRDWDRAGFAAFAALSEGPSLWRHQMRAIMGDVLEREGLPVAAMNCYRWCLRAQGSAELGGFWSTMAPEGVADCERRLEAISRRVESGPALSCDACAAEFPAGWHACVHCGTTRPAGEACAMCVGDPPLMQDPRELEFCPVCRRYKQESGREGNAYLVQREPKGMWSTLAWK